jgi:hypothetical protein
MVESTVVVENDAPVAPVVEAATTPAEKVSNATVIKVYKEVQAAGGGWKEIGTRLGSNGNAASARVQTLKKQMGEAIEAMRNADGTPKFTAIQIDDYILKAFPPIKRTGGGRKSDKQEAVASLIAELGIDME